MEADEVAVLKASVGSDGVVEGDCVLDVFVGGDGGILVYLASCSFVEGWSRGDLRRVGGGSEAIVWVERFPITVVSRGWVGYNW